jgi:DNA-binding NarL/FixJ family response regulator
VLLKHFGGQVSKAKGPGERVTVLLAAGDRLSSQLLAGALKRCRDRFEVVGIASTTHETLHGVQLHQPHVVVLRPELQDGESGFDALQQLRPRYPGTATIMLLPTHERAGVMDAFRAGARGVICRADSFRILAKCIRLVHEGQVWAGNRDVEYLLDAVQQDRLLQLNGPGGAPFLTQREEEVTRLVAEGMTNRDIAHALHVAEHTVSNYLYRIFDKVGVSSRVQLILYALSRTATGLDADVTSTPKGADSVRERFRERALKA